MRDAGPVAQEVSQFITSGIQTAMSGISTFLQNATVSTQASASAMSAAVVASFGELQEQGMSLREALATVEPVIFALQEQMIEAGFDGGAAFAQLQAFAAMAKDEIAGPALDAVAGLNQGLVGLHNSGLLNQDMFAGLRCRRRSEISCGRATTAMRRCG